MALRSAAKSMCLTGSPHQRRFQNSPPLHRMGRATWVLEGVEIFQAIQLRKKDFEAAPMNIKVLTSKVGQLPLVYICKSSYRYLYSISYRSVLASMSRRSN